MRTVRTAMLVSTALVLPACSNKQTAKPTTETVESGAPDADGGEGVGGDDSASGGAGTEGGGSAADGSGTGDASGSGSAGDGTTDTSATGEGAGEDGADAPDHVVTTDNDTDVFEPADLVVSIGETVRFEMTSRHNAVQVSEEVYNERRVEPLEGGFVVWFGQTEDIVFSEPGVYYYICEPHVLMDMVGTITVE